MNLQKRSTMNLQKRSSMSPSLRTAVPGGIPRTAKMKKNYLKHLKCEVRPVSLTSHPRVALPQRWFSLAKHARALFSRGAAVGVFTPTPTHCLRTCRLPY